MDTMRAMADEADPPAATSTRIRRPRTRKPSPSDPALGEQKEKNTNGGAGAEVPPKPRRRYRRDRKAKEQTAISDEKEATPAVEGTSQEERLPTPPRRRDSRSTETAVEAPPTFMPTPDLESSERRFVGPGESEFAQILDFYGIKWEYEPRTFPLRWEHGHVAEAFSPDFYLPDLNLYVEVTTLKTGLTAEKNRKVRLVKQLYPEVNIRLLKKRDLLRLLTKYGYGPLAPQEVPDVDRIFINTPHLQKRVKDLGAAISRDYAGKDPILVGVLRGVMCFMADLIRNVSLSIHVDFLAVSDFEGASAIKILKDLDENIMGRDVILVEDIVDTGMTVNHIVDYLWAKKPASLRICTLLDKSARRLINVDLAYVGFEAPDEFLVGYGLDFRQRYRNLPFVAVLKHELLP